MRPLAPRKALVVAVIVAATLLATRVSGEDPNAVLTGDADQLRAYATSLLQEIEHLRAEIARLTRERDELAKEVAEARDAQHALQAERGGNSPRDLAPRDRIEGSRLVGSGDLRGSDSKRAEQVEGTTLQREVRGGETEPLVGAAGGRRPTAGPSPARSEGFAFGDASPSQRREAESHVDLPELESQLREARQREQAVRTSVKNLEQALDAEKHAARSKLEALESVLLDARSASTQLRAELDETRQRNTELSREVSLLQGATTEAGQPSARDQARQSSGVQQPTPLAGKHLPPPGSPGPDAQKGKELASAGQPSHPSAVEMSPEAESNAAEDPATKDLQEQLSVERERRETLEEEVKRLTTSGNSDDRFVEVWNALQSARSEILVLGNQLAEERKDREDLEIALARTQQDPASKSNTDLAKRLEQALNDRRAEADRLAAQLKDANEMIVRLKGRLEASGSPEEGDKLLADLQKDNESLRKALNAAEEANQALRGKAEMAQRLAEMVYGKGP
jgi:DNA repair exonuclease SbcCD ATPase subunit